MSSNKVGRQSGLMLSEKDIIKLIDDFPYLDDENEGDDFEGKKKLMGDLKRWFYYSFELIKTQLA